MEAESDTQQNAPEHHGHSVHPSAPDPSPCEQQDAADRDWKPVILAKPDVETILAEIR